MARGFSNLRLDCRAHQPAHHWQSPPWGMFNLRITRIAISDMIGTVLQEPPPLTNGQYPGPTSSKTREHSIDVAHQRQGALWPRARGAFFNFWILWISIEITEGWNMPKHLLYRWQIPPMSNNLVMPTYCLIFAVLIAQLVDFLQCLLHYWLIFDQGCHHCIPHLWDWTQDRHDSSKGAKCWRKYSFNQ